MRYYLAGKMTGLPNFGYDSFARLTAKLRSAGLDIASPHEIDYDETRIERGSRPYKEYLAGGLELLLRQCDGIIMMTNWKDSTGARLEREAAIAAKFDVVHLLSDDPLEFCLNDSRGIMGATLHRTGTQTFIIPTSLLATTV